MKHVVERDGEVAVVSASGRLDFSAAAGFQALLEPLVAKDADARALIIDCGGLEYVSSAGLRVFLLAAKNAQRTGRYFAVCALEPAVREVFELSGFNRVIALHADRAAALSGARAPRP